MYSDENGLTAQFTSKFQYVAFLCQLENSLHIVASRPVSLNEIFGENLCHGNSTRICVPHHDRQAVSPVALCVKYSNWLDY